MIRLEDIRIGNYFLGFDNKPFKWELEHFTMVGSSSIDFDEIIKEPIPLTEEWLLKLGFIKKIGNHGEYYAHNKYSGFRVWKSNVTSCWVIGRKQFDNNSTYWIVDLKNVNQIQNLFYDLTGEELKATL